jgi:mevalonate kinase
MYEVCGNLIPDPQDKDKLIIHPTTVSFGSEPEVGGRASCTNKEYSQIIFHTHPITSYAPPSVEDIGKVLKHTEIGTSVIITSWGVFQIVRLTRDKYVLTEDDKRNIKSYIDNINKATVNPDYLTKRGKEEALNIAKNIAKETLTGKHLRSISDNIKKINDHLVNKAVIYLEAPNIYTLE